MGHDNAHIDFKMESISNYQIRKIKWAIEELENGGQELTY